MKNCPCQENCPTGCPCSDYQCPNSHSWILVLNTREASNVPLIIDGNGQSKEIEFAYGSETETDSTCSIIWRGSMYVLGGDTYKTQISLVDRCRLEKIGDLPFNMKYGACAQRDDEEVFICFEDYKDSSTYKNCHVASGPLESFSNLPSSTYEHSNTRIAVTSGKPHS